MAINSLSSMSHGMSGLASGMDTQSMVDAMLAGTQAKIDKQTSNKSRLTYKRDMYRDTTSSLRNLQNNFLKLNSTGVSLKYNSFFNAMNATTKSSPFKVAANNSASAGKTTVNSISQLAQSLKKKSASDVTSDVKGKLDTTALKEGAEIQVTLDGVKKTIKLEKPTADEIASAGSEEKAIEQKLQAAINHGFGNGINVAVNAGEITFKATDTSRKFSITGSKESMDVLGLTSGISNKINRNMRLDQINFKEPLQGGVFEFTINGEKFSFKSSDTLNTVMSKVNSSGANVKMDYSELEDRFILESTVSGTGTKIEMSQESGNLLSSMFGHTGSSGYIGKDIQTTIDLTGANKVATTKDITRYAEAKGEFSFSINGKSFSFKMADQGKGAEYTSAEFIDEINAKLATEYPDENIKFAMTGDKVTMTAKPGTEIVMGSGMSLMGFKTGATNQRTAVGTDTLESIGLGNGSISINGTDIPFGGANTINDLLGAINAQLGGNGTAKIEDGRIQIFGVKIPIDIEFSDPDVGKKLFGTGDAINLSNSQTSNLEHVRDGQNAKLKINGVDVERNSNSFTLDGLSFELDSITQAKNADGSLKFEADGKTPVIEEVNDTVDVTRNTEQIFEGIVKFMDEYNKLVDELAKLTKAEPVYKDYPPLTPEQKAELSESEIKLWEEKSKQGLLRNDDALQKVMDDMRTAMSSKPNGAKFDLYDIGITTSYDFEKGIGGKLTFVSSDNGAKLREMITQNPQEVEKLFTDAEKGIAVVLDTAIDAAAKGGASAQGTLVRLAGSTGTPDTSSKIYKEMRDIDKNLEALKRTYKSQYTRYWKQFNNMEQVISNMNQQSSWLSSQFS